MSKPKYIIEGGIDFFSELYKSLDVEEDVLEDDNNKCLISNQVLTDKHVQLNCGHKFNYIELYHDFVNHKKKFNFLESSDGKLLATQNRCPYCRTKQNIILPYYKELGLNPINGVNCYIPIIKKLKKLKPEYTICACEYLLPNADFDATLPVLVMIEQFTKCGNPVTGTLANFLFSDNGDNHLYCYTHTKLMKKHYKDLIKTKQDQEKAQKKAEKNMLLQQNKLLKQKDKPVVNGVVENKVVVENVVLGPSMVIIEPSMVIIEPSMVITEPILITGCSQLLKTGQKKGTACNCKIFMDGMCKRHHLIHL